MEQTPTTKQALTQKARGRPHTMINVDAAASTEASSHPPSVPVPPIKSPANGSNSPAGHASAHRGAVTASQSATKRGLLSAEATRPAKLAKGSSPTPVRPGAQVARTGRPLAAARGPGLGVRHTVRMRAEDPWTRYKKLYEIMLDDFTTVAVHKDKSYDPVIVRNFREDKAIAARTKTLHEIRHENLLVLLESFSFKGYRYLIFERISVSLVEVVACPHSPSVHELVAVIGQIVAGLEFLESHGIVHGALGCSNVFLTTEGVIKISGHEGPREDSPSSSVDVITVGHIAMNLMQGAPLDDGRIGLEHPEQWPEDAQLFLPAAISLTSIKGLSQLPLLSRPCEPARLKWIYDIARDSVMRRFKYNA